MQGNTRRFVRNIANFGLIMNVSLRHGQGGNMKPRLGDRRNENPVKVRIPERRFVKRRVNKDRRKDEK